MQMSEFQKRQKEKAERRARKYAARAAGSHERARSHIEHIPPGQPILMGHHSQRKHERALERHDRDMRKSIEADKAARSAEWAARRAGRAISADDPDALDLLRAKLDALESKRAAIKEHNKRARKEGTERAPAYMLQNLGNEIRRVKARITDLEARAERTERAPAEGAIGGLTFTIEECSADNRIRIYFDGIPPRELRGSLKRAGWRWARSVGAWQRQITPAAIQSVRTIFPEISW